MSNEIPAALRNLTRRDVLAGARDGRFEVRELNGNLWVFPSWGRKTRRAKPSPPPTAPIKARSPRRDKPSLRYTLRLKSYADQDAHCFYCNRRPAFAEWTTDHKTPRARGGTDAAENLVGCCADCNQIKGPLTADEFFAVQHDDRLRKAKVAEVSAALTTALTP